MAHASILKEVIAVIVLLVSPALTANRISMSVSLHRASSAGPASTPSARTSVNVHPDDQGRIATEIMMSVSTIHA